MRDAYVAVILDTQGVCDAAVGDRESMLIGPPIVPLDTTRTEWSAHPCGVDREPLDAGVVDVDVDDSGVSGVLSVSDDSEGEDGGARACTGTGGGIGRGGDVDGGGCGWAAAEGEGAEASGCELYDVVEDTGEGAGEDSIYVG